MVPATYGMGLGLVVDEKQKCTLSFIVKDSDLVVSKDNITW